MLVGSRAVLWLAAGLLGMGSSLSLSESEDEDEDDFSALSDPTDVRDIACVWAMEGRGCNEIERASTATGDKVRLAGGSKGEDENNA